MGHLLALVLALLAAWQFSVWRNPWTKCRRCAGIGKFFGWLATRSWHNCPRCDDTGKQLRVGARQQSRRR